MKNRKRYKRTRSISKAKSNNKIGYFFIAFCCITIGIILIEKGLNYQKKIESLYTYTAEKSSDYEVLLKPNDFYTEKVLPSGRYYASKSIDSYIINFKYNFNADKENNLEYNYNVTANLVGVVKNINDQDKEVWNRNFILCENKSNKQENIDKFSIEEKININYETYNNLARSYEQKYGIVIDATLKVRFNISYNINLASLNIDNENVEDYIELDIPITNTVSEVRKNYEEISSKNINPQIEDFNNRIIYYIIGALFILIPIICVVIKIIKNKKEPKDIYINNINHILKYYKDIIVTVTNQPDISNLKIMNVSILDDLIDVAEQNQSNIIHYETIENKESNLYVIVNNYVYIYKITKEKLIF